MSPKSSSIILRFLFLQSGFLVSAKARFFPLLQPVSELPHPILLILFPPFRLWPYRSTIQNPPISVCPGSLGGRLRYSLVILGQLWSFFANRLLVMFWIIRGGNKSWDNGRRAQAANSPNHSAIARARQFEPMPQSGPEDLIPDHYSGYTCTPNCLTFVKTTAIAYHQKPEALVHFLPICNSSCFYKRQEIRSSSWICGRSWMRLLSQDLFSPLVQVYISRVLLSYWRKFAW